MTSSIGDDADHLAARLQRRIRHRAHQAELAAAIDHADAALGQRAADMRAASI
jgi:hypothetical protein